MFYPPKCRSGWIPLSENKVRVGTSRCKSKNNSKMPKTNVREIHYVGIGDKGHWEILKS